MKKKTSDDTSKTSQFDMILFEAVRDGLSSIGSSIPPAVLPYFKRKGSIGPGGVINDPEAFHENLKEIFGFGSKLIENKILELLYTKLGISVENENNHSFPEKIENLQRTLGSTKTRAAVFEPVKLQY
jgi:hypothetical protein